MKANSFIRAVVSLGFGALAYFAVPAALASQTTIEAVPIATETQKPIVMAEAPHAERPKTEVAERFVEYVVETTTPKPRIDPQIAIDAAAKVAKERQERLEQQARQAKLAAKVAAEKAKKAAIEKAKQIKAEKERKEKEERERKEKEAAAAKKAREATRGVPVPGAVIGATFGATGPWARYHTGLDFRASYGTPVKAVANGRIVYAGNKGNWAGNHVVIKHPDGKKTLYAHMSSIRRHGGRVHAGDVIGRVGQTGRAFGSHLHLELYPAGASPGDVYSAIDPRPWLRNRGLRLG